MKRTLIATIAGTTLIAAGAYAGGDKANQAQSESPGYSSSQSSTERTAEAQSPQTSSSSSAQTTAPSSESTPSTAQSSSQSSESSSAQSSLPQSSPQASSQDSETVKQVQDALAAQGYDPGPVDGKLGPRTKGALKQAQKDKGVSETGQIDSQTLAALGVNESGGSSSGMSRPTGG